MKCRKCHVELKAYKEIPWTWADGIFHLCAKCDKTLCEIVKNWLENEFDIRGGK